MTDRVRLVLLSFLMLFVELALIRWAGSNVIYLAYFSNFVLLGSFLGIGIGFLRERAKADLFRWTPVALAGLVAFVVIFPVKIDRSGSDLIYFGEFGSTGLPLWITLPTIFVAVAAIMAMIAQGVARTFARLEPLDAYRFDILGSILGIAAFSILAFTYATPVVWGVAAAIGFVVLCGRRLPVASALALVALVGMLGYEALSQNTIWSPYYKLTFGGYAAPDGSSSATVTANGIPHQFISSVSARRRLEPIYFRPYERAPDNPLNDVLIVGAGNGTDVAIALDQGAKHIDAVEIDPRLYELGREMHPDRPYQNPAVDAYVDDGRAFLEKTDQDYDMIIFALPDSLTLVSGQSSLRLESYLFTSEAMQEAREHLKPEGVFVMYNYYREGWLIDRLAKTLAQTYGRSPCVETIGTVGGLAVFMAPNDPAALECPSVWSPQGEVPAPASDDWPFVYLIGRAIPAIYLWTVLLILGASLLMVRVSSGPLRRMGPYVDLFFMGTAFLLLETKNVVQFALLFGTTWFVNALVFGGILVTVYLAVELSRRVVFRRPALLYLWLLAALAVAFVVPQEALLTLSLPIRFVVATALAFTPVFLSNLVFAQRFRQVGSSTVAFGANLLGAMIGGLFEYSALLIGYNALLLVAGALYGLAFLTGRRHLRPEASNGPAREGGDLAASAARAES